MNRQLKAAFAAGLVGLSVVGPGAYACPSYLSVQDLELPAGKRSEVRLFALNAEGSSWINVPVQVDPLDEKGILRAPPSEGYQLNDQLVSNLDRLSLRIESFGPRAAIAMTTPCKATRAIELSTVGADARYAYLTVCENDDGKTLAQATSPVDHNAKQLKISTPRFGYDYQKNNQLMYRSLTVKNSKWPAPVLAASDADLNMHLDLRRFFTLDFTNDDVESYVGNSSIGPVGMVGSIDFFLRLLVFKINLKMGTTVGFYADSAHIPAVIDVPRDASTMLHAGSGLLYMWKPQATVVDQSHPDRTMPMANPTMILEGFQTDAVQGMKYCTTDPCVYRLRGTVKDEDFALDVNVPKHLVERGFYPQWVPDVAQFKKNMKWDSNPKKEAGNVALFFDNSGLIKGQYQFDQWIRLGKATDFVSTCPTPVNVGQTVTFGASVVAH